MNIAIDTTPLISGHAARGVGVYTKNLIEALQRYETKHSYSFFTRGEKIPSNAEIVHYPYFDPFFLTLPYQNSIPTVVTVHDLIPLVFPDNFRSGIRGMIKWQIQKLALKKVDRILTVSECSKKDVIKIVGIDSSKIDVVYSAGAPEYRKITNKGTLDSLRRKYGLPDKFFVYVGDVNWNKNVPGMIQAFARFVPKAKDCSLVLVGKSFLDETLQETKEIRALIKKLQIEKYIVFPGYVPSDDLAGLYSMAICSLEPSYYEGFGLPVLESMMCGCPVLVANNSSLLEIAGPSIQLDALSSETIVNAMNLIVSFSPEARKKMSADGITWSHQFSWEKTAKQTIAVYEKALG